MEIPLAVDNWVKGEKKSRRDVLLLRQKGIMRNNLESVDSPGLGVSIWRDLPFEIRPQTLLKCLTKQLVCEVTQNHLRRLLYNSNDCLHLSHLLHHEGILQMMLFWPRSSCFSFLCSAVGLCVGQNHYGRQPLRQST